MSVQNIKAFRQLLEGSPELMDQLRGGGDVLEMAKTLGVEFEEKHLEEFLETDPELRRNVECNCDNRR